MQTKKRTEGALSFTNYSKQNKGFQQKPRNKNGIVSAWNSWDLSFFVFPFLVLGQRPFSCSGRVEVQASGKRTALCIHALQETKEREKLQGPCTVLVLLGCTELLLSSCLRGLGTNRSRIRACRFRILFLCQGGYVMSPARKFL